MKLSDKELREIAANPNDEGAPVCAELLTLRREVRRLRRCVRDMASLIRSDFYNPAVMEATIRSALKPKRGAK